MQTYTGHCHCGAVQFEVEADVSKTMRCNCSFCMRRGTVLHKVPAERFTLKAGEGALTCYGKRDFSDHFFCSTCGIHCFTKVTRPNESSVVVNVGCLDGVDALALTPTIFDGANLL